MSVWIRWDREGLLRLIAGRAKGGAFRMTSRAFERIEKREISEKSTLEELAGGLAVPALRLPPCLFVSLRPRQRLPVISGVMKSVALNLPLRLFGGLVDRIRSAVDGVVCALSSRVDGLLRIRCCRCQSRKRKPAHLTIHLVLVLMV